METSQKSKGLFWRREAQCKFSDCRRFEMSKHEDPRGHTGDIIVNIQILGHEKQTSAISHHRQTHRSREGGGKQLGEFTPTNLYTKKMASASEGKLNDDNFKVPSFAVIQNISRKKKLKDRLDKNPSIVLILIQQKQDSDNPQRNLKHQYL